MNIRKIKFLSFAAIIATVAFIACKDDFSEEDFLKLQSDLAIKEDSVKLLQQFKTLGVESQKQAESYLAALNEAGDLMQVTILVRADNKPVSGVQVSLTGASGAATTNADGVATFDRVRIGESTISISKTGYTSATALVTFGSPGQPVPTTVTTGGYNGTSITRYVAPAKRFENIGLPIFALGANEGSTAVIRGTVTYEKDLTNDAPEVPEGLTITANFRDILLDPSEGGAEPQSSNSGYTEILSYQFAEGTLGVATVQANGNYEMRVPATVAGLNGITLNVPEIVDNQTAVIAAADNGLGGTTPIASGPEKRTNIQTRWRSSGSASPTITVPTLKVFFPEPPAPGRGYSPTFARVARPIDIGTYCETLNQDNNGGGGTTITLLNRGVGYTSSPTVSFSGTGTVATASLRGYISSASITSGGSGYPSSTTVLVEFTETLADGTVQRLDNMQRISVSTNASGVIDIGALPLPAAEGYTTSNPFETSQGIGALGVRILDAFGGPTTPVANATIAVNRITELESIEITQAGVYSEKPTITISGGGATTQASALVSEYRVKWQSTLLSASAPTTPYKVVPSAFNFLWPSTSVSGALPDADANIDVYGNLGNLISNAATLKSLLTTDGTNLIISPANSGLTFQTDQSWDAAPQLIIVDEAPTRGVAAVEIVDGAIDYISFPNKGNGYDEATIAGVTIQPVYTGAPGSGGVVTFTPTISAGTKEATNIAASVVSGGSNYRENANRSSQNPSVDAIPAVKTGQTYKVDIKLGTGVRLTNVAGL